MPHPGFAGLEQALGYKFKKEGFITEALTHRSFRHESQSLLDNERFEFLGDAVLDLCVSEAIMEIYREKREGQLSKIRSQLVSESSLAKIANSIRLGDALYLGKGEELSGGRTRESILADTLEAVIAAVYLDGGLESARTVIHHLFGLSSMAAEEMVQRADMLLDLDAKSRLQEFFQSLCYPTPQYICLKVHGPEHSRVFTMGLFVQNTELARARARTKKEATQKAAREFLAKIAADTSNLLILLKDKNLQPSRVAITTKEKRDKKKPLKSTPAKPTPIKPMEVRV